MSTPDRMDPGLQGAAGNGAYADQQARMAADAAQMATGAAPGHDQQLVHFGGQPSIAEQMKTHVQPPSTPDTGGHQSASDPIG